MKKFKLPNGLTVLHDARKSDTVTIEISVGTGSNNEPSSIAGISHFLEHMAFEGTKIRTAKQISETIENVGGEMNAATGNERTFFYMKLPKDKTRLGLEIMSDMLTNPAFEPKSFEKEKRVVLEEIKMVNDQPLMYQWVLFEKNLFKRHPTKNPVYGRVNSVKSITPAKMRAYFEKWYVPQNMTLSVVGDIRNLPALARKYLGSIKRRPVPKLKSVKEPEDKRPTLKKERRNINQAYFVLGYKTVTRLHKDSVALDVISSIFSKGLSGRINEEIRVKRGLAYSVGSFNESKKNFGMFAIYLNCDRKNLKLAKSIVLEELRKLDNLTTKEINEAKGHIIGKTLIDHENSHHRADEMAFWEFIKDAKLADQYLKNVRKVTKKDILRVRDKYLNKNYTQVVISK